VEQIDFVLREIDALQTHIWFLHGQFVMVLVGLVGLGIQIRRNGNKKNKKKGKW